MSTVLERLQLRTGETDTDLLNDIIESAMYAILARRYPLHEYPTQEVTTTDDDGNEVTTTEVVLEDRYKDLQFRIALDLYNKIGAEGEIIHAENGISRSYESSWISKQLLNEVVPYCRGGVLS